jgi:hypothetical protein
MTLQTLNNTRELAQQSQGDSGTPEELMQAAGIAAGRIAEAAREVPSA